METEEEQLTDCDFFPTICRWLEWFKSDGGLEPITEQPLGSFVSDVDVSQYDYSDSTPVSLGGSNTCPAPVSLPVSIAGGTGVSFEWTPVCNLATTLRPLFLTLIAMSALFAFTRAAS